MIEERKKSRAPPLTYELWPHLIIEKERKERRHHVDIRVRPKF